METWPRAGTQPGRSAPAGPVARPCGHRGVAAMMLWPSASGAGGRFPLAPPRRAAGREKSMVRQADLDRIRRRLDTLPMVQRAVFLLCRIDGLDFDQIAWRLGIDRDAVERHLGQAITVIAFGPREGDEERR